MKTSDFDYELPREPIAQTPVEPRDHSRLMVVSRSGGSIAHRRFYDLPEYLRAGDVIVLNDTRVVPARLHGTRSGTGGRVELLLLLSRPPPPGGVHLRRPGQEHRAARRNRPARGRRHPYRPSVLRGEAADAGTGAPAAVHSSAALGLGALPDRLLPARRQRGGPNRGAPLHARAT